ncbi:MAG: hypothetical protein LBO79_06260 [Zoogloeaceae bacterium]|jgi:hypothetical protein|nr:hypothetical protein [Zoogloeaceae bacterium]
MTDINDENDLVFVSDSMSVGGQADAHDVVALWEHWERIEGVSVVDRVAVADVLDGESTAMMLDRVGVSEAMTSLQFAIVDSRDRVVARDSLGGRQTADLHDFAQATETLTASRVSRLSSHDRVGVRERLWGGTTRQADSIDSVQARDWLQYGSIVTLADTAFVSDALSGTSAGRADFFDALRLVDVLEGPRSSVEDCIDRLFASEHTSTLNAAVVTVACRARLVDVLEDDRADSRHTGVAFTTCLPARALSRYLHLPVVRGATVRGKTLYLACADGLYALDGHHEEVRALLVTGEIDLAGRSSKLAHPEAIYAEYEAEGELAAFVTQTQGGVAEGRYRYPFPLRPARVLTNNRVVVGKGLRGRHFTFSLKLRARQARLLDWRALVIPLARRIERR